MAQAGGLHQGEAEVFQGRISACMERMESDRVAVSGSIYGI